MNWIVSQEVIDKTTECCGEFKCLRHVQARCDCVVKFVAGNGKLILECAPAAECPYHELYGLGDLCTCPTLYALHEKYGVHRK